MKRLLADQLASPEGGQLLAEGDGVAFDLDQGFARLMVRGPQALEQAGGTLLVVAPQPFPHRGHGVTCGHSRW